MTFPRLLPIFVFCLAASALADPNPYCRSRTYPENAAYRRSQAFKMKQLESFANSKPVGELADHLLSKLIAAKSPVILSWIKRRHLDTNKPDGLVHAWRRYYAENFLLRSGAKGDPRVDAKITALFDRIYGEAFDTKSRERFNRLFREAKNYALATVSGFSLNDRTKTEIRDRVQGIGLYWMKTFQGSKFKKMPLEGLSWGIAYDPGTNEINMGIEALRYTDDDTIVAVFSHEIGHSFDPCRWGVYFKGNDPFEKLISCLRSPRSVAAKKRDDSKMSEMVKGGVLSKELELALSENPTCNKLEYPPIGVQNDQIDESFADWFSAEVLSHDTKRVSLKSRADLCEPRSLVPGSSYPANSDRLTRLYLVQPAIRKALKIPAEKSYGYCSLN